MNKLLLSLIATAMLGTIAVSSAVAETAQKTVAKVGNVPVTELDVQWLLQRRLPMQVNFHGGIQPEKLEEFKKAAVEEAILRAYKVQYAMDNEIALEAGAVDAEWQAAIKKNPELAQSTDKQQAARQAEVYLDLLAAKAEKAAVDDKVVITPVEVKNYYQANKEKFFQPKLYKASHIFIKVDPADNAEEKEARKQRAEKLLARAKAGEDFYNLAYYESDDRTRYVGGSLGSFHAGQTVKEFDDVVQTMKVGEIRGLLKTLYGYHVVKLDDVQPERQLSYEEAAEKIQQMYAQQRRKQLYDEWVAELRVKYPLQH